MEILKLCELLNTKYIINGLNGILDTTLSNYVGKQVCIDLAYCRFGPESAVILNKYYKSVDFINTEDEKLNELLQHNINTCRNIPDEYELLVIKNTDSINKFHELFNDLPKNSKYKVECGLGSMKDKAILIMLVLARPDIEFDIRQCASDIYDFIRDVWISSAEQHDEYYELLAPHTVLVKKNKDGLFGDISYGYLKEYNYIRDRKVIPTDFGNSQIIKLDGSGVVEEWKPVVEKCLKVFEVSESTKKTAGKVVKNFLTLRGE